MEHQKTRKWWIREWNEKLNKEPSKTQKSYQNFENLTVGNNENKNIDYQNQFYFYFDFSNFRVGRARKTTNQIGLA